MPVNVTFLEIGSLETKDKIIKVVCNPITVVLIKRNLDTGTHRMSCEDRVTQRDYFVNTEAETRIMLLQTK